MISRLKPLSLSFSFNVYVCSFDFDSFFDQDCYFERSEHLKIFEGNHFFATTSAYGFNFDFISSVSTLFTNILPFANEERLGLQTPVCSSCD